MWEQKEGNLREFRPGRRKRNSPDNLGAETHVIAVFIHLIGRGASYAGRSGTGRSRGRHRRENAGMSNEMQARNLHVESPRFPGEGSSAQGKSGPKVRTEVVADGEQVEIPAPPV